MSGILGCVFCFEFELHFTSRVTSHPSLMMLIVSFSYYKNYTALLQHLAIETVPMPLSWFLNSKVRAALRADARRAGRTPVRSLLAFSQLMKKPLNFEKKHICC